MTRPPWKRSDVELGQVWDHDGLLYKVVGLIDDPVVVMVPLDERYGEDREHIVIGSQQFTEWTKLEQVMSGGTREDFNAGT